MAIDRVNQSKGVWEHEEEKFSRARANERPVTLAGRVQLRVGDRSQITQYDQIPALCSSLREE